MCYFIFYILLLAFGQDCCLHFTLWQLNKEDTKSSIEVHIQSSLLIIVFYLAKSFCPTLLLGKEPTKKQRTATKEILRLLENQQLRLLCIFHRGQELQ